MKPYLFCALAVVLTACSSGSPPKVIPTEDMSPDIQQDATLDVREDVKIEPDANVIEDMTMRPDTNDMAADMVVPECPKILPETVSFDVLEGFSGSEDFVFDELGNVVSIQDGNLTRRAIDGNPELIAAGFGDTAGIRQLPNGDYVLANVEQGSLTRITPAGGQTTILSGINYPNGVEVDSAGTIYVAEHDAGRVREVNADTGAFTIIADELFNPNGVYLSPDEQILYIGSFGEGTLHSVTRNANGWDPKVLVAEVSPPSQYGFCDIPGEVCMVNDDVQGICNNDQYCSLPLVNCVNEDAACTNAIGLQETCLRDSQNDLICPGVPTKQIVACDGLAVGANCSVDGVNGICDPVARELNSGSLVACATGETVCSGAAVGQSCYEFGGIGSCVNDPNFGKFCTLDFGDQTPCAGKQIGEDCSNSGYGGVCADGNQYGFNGVICVPTTAGGLDGVNVDACGNIYMTEFTSGKIFRITPDGEKVESIVTLPSSWIPNMHWGLGVGGFETDRLYVMDRDEGRLFSLEVDIESARSKRGEP